MDVCRTRAGSRVWETNVLARECVRRYAARLVAERQRRRASGAQRGSRVVYRRDAEGGFGLEKQAHFRRWYFVRLSNNKAHQLKAAFYGGNE